MMQVVSSINGKIVDRRQATVSIYDNSFLYAEGLFETLLGIGERLVFLDEHLERLSHGAEVTGLSLPVSRQRLARWLKEATQAHRAHIKKVRLTITSGESSRWVGKSGKPQVIIYVSPHELPRKPYRLYLSDLRVDHRSIFRQIKTLSYSIHAAALRQAQARRFHDALLLNEAGRVAEVTSANLFWVKRKRVFTPPLGAGCLDGITRAAVIRELRLLGLDVTEQDGTMKTLAAADELFISSSLKLVIGVSEIANETDRLVFQSGRVTETLSRHFLFQLGLQAS